MKYLIASDIHGSAKYCEMLADAFEKEGADRLILLGDLLYHGPRNDLPDGYCPKKVIPILNGLADRITAVRGNCDAEVDQMVLDFPITADYAPIIFGSRTLFATHGHIFAPGSVKGLKSGDVFLYGHTHIPDSRVESGVLYLNPGSVSIPKAGSARGYIVTDSDEKNGHLTFIRKNLETGEELEKIVF